MRIIHKNYMITLFSPTHMPRHIWDEITESKLNL